MNNPVEMPEADVSPEVKAFYEKCFEFWSGACNPQAGIRFILREADKLDLDINRDPGVRLVLCHIASLMGLNGTGGYNGDPLLSEKVLELSK